VAQDEYGNPINYIMAERMKNDPITFDARLTYLVKLTKGLTDFSALTKSAKTKATKSFLDTIENGSGFKSGKPKGNPKNDSNMQSLLDSI
jgi:hypothetical protein